MTIQDIQNLLVILSEGSINKASTKLYISQPALSKMIRKIEQEYDITLFVRTPGEHTLRLTGEGEIFFDQIRHINDEHEILLERLKEKKERRHSVINIGMSPRVSNLISPKLVKWLHDHHPEVFIRVIENNSTELEKAVENGEIDMAYVSRHTLHDDMLSYVIVNEIHNYIYLRRGCDAWKKAVICEDLPYPCLSFRDISDEVLAVSSPDHRASQLISLLESRSGITFRKKIENNPVNRIQLADIGQCTTIISSMGLYNSTFDTDRLFCLCDEDSITISQILCYLPKFRNTPQVSIMSEAFHAVTEDFI